ncbi:MAG: squalene synthase HpnC [Myxococcota bacterium]|nr:squalene synthase HpnC [Myxococcota bacterium]
MGRVAQLALPDSTAVMSRAAGENFPVALRVLPAALRRHLRALYGFARLVDDVGDEAAGDRRRLLDEVDLELDRVSCGTPRHPLMRELARSARELALPEAPLRALVEANRRDQMVVRYASWPELADYCALSAQPVGRLVLHVFGCATPARIARSDAICTALQLVEHCQDVAEDAARGRIYLPADERARFGCDERALRAPQASPALRALLAFQIGRVRGLLREGEPLVASLRGWARLAVAGFAAGGWAAAEAVERCGYDVLAHRAVRQRRDLVRHGLRLWLAAREG